MAGEASKTSPLKDFMAQGTELGTYSLFTANFWMMLHGL